MCFLIRPEKNLNCLVMFHVVHNVAKANNMKMENPSFQCNYLGGHEELNHKL